MKKICLLLTFVFVMMLGAAALADMDVTELNVQFVRPDRALFQGPVASLVLVTYAGELGVYPGHAAEIVALGNGVVRMKKLPQDGGGEENVVVSGGYAEIQDDEVIVSTERGRSKLTAKVTNRIMPGVVSIPQGGWYEPETRDPESIGSPDTLDLGGCISVLTSVRPTPISKGNGVHSNLCKIEKA